MTLILLAALAVILVAVAARRMDPVAALVCVLILAALWVATTGRTHL